MITATSEEFWSGMIVISLEARISQAGRHSASLGCGFALRFAVKGRGRAIVLIGFMGSGKSSAGRILARKTGWARFDTDEIVAARFGRPIAEIFEEFGEEKFRDAESETLEGLSADGTSVVVTGGGIILRPGNVEFLRRLGTVAYLEADEETLFRRISRRGTRPLLQTENPRATLAELLHIRLPLYRQAADFHIDTSRLTHEEVAEAVIKNMESL
jgi:shikimate kinase